jgi:HK97 gp10 family phage protein
MSDLSLTVDLSAFDQALRQLGELATPALETAMEAGALVLEGAAKVNAPVKDGTLRDSLTHVLVVSDSGVTAYVGTNIVYAEIQEFGGWIEPTGTYLHFIVGGEEIFVREVYIPAQPYMRPALDDNRAAIADTIGITFARELGAS